MSRIQKGSSSTVHFLGIKWQNNLSRYFGDMLQINKSPKLPDGGNSSLLMGLSSRHCRHVPLRRWACWPTPLTGLRGHDVISVVARRAFWGTANLFSSKWTLAGNLSPDTALGEDSGESLSLAAKSRGCGWYWSIIVEKRNGQTSSGCWGWAFPASQEITFGMAAAGTVTTWRSAVDPQSSHSLPQAK